MRNGNTKNMDMKIAHSIWNQVKPQIPEILHNSNGGFARAFSLPIISCSLIVTLPVDAM
jgi:hypothetical protein